MELGSTMVRIVCQRVAPRFQQASRNDIGTAASASRVLVMITGRVITASVQQAAAKRLAHAGRQHERPHAEQPVHDAGHAGQVHHGHVDRSASASCRGRIRSGTRRPACPPARPPAAIRAPGRTCPPAAPRCRRCHVVLRVLPDERQRKRRPGLDHQDGQDGHQRQHQHQRHRQKDRTGRWSPSICFHRSSGVAANRLAGAAGEFDLWRAHLLIADSLDHQVGRHVDAEGDRQTAPRR